MDRRRYLALLALGLSGCVGAPGDSTPTNTEPAPTDTEITPTPRPPVTDATRRDGGEPEWTAVQGLEPDASPFVTYVVGNPVARPTDIEPRYVVVENQADASQTMTVRVRDRTADRPAVEEELSFPAGGICQLELAEPARYEVTVTASGVETTVTISRFDCNDATTSIFVGPEGTAETQTISTMVGCATASV
ncbi:hypothetical protein [Haloarcula salinisoli]|uniref:Ig-like domain-containing protein n=1 Tax=Haloarcula salinisoli TaxID=2487746 RepID=A0A8J7YAC1_9EURY|nr:hypothetical protein [Halomicroarcula salinisoli]MBX0286211.1 hypothetical protein [Halomicroarcula salinisoli]MBX0302300.1 hypothetical protein [Halomicroarcula salinisoli]